MKIGKLRYPVNIEHKVVTIDPVYGTDIVSWELLAQVWANAAGVSGREYLSSTIENASTTFKMTMRYRGDIDTSMRIVHGEVVYQIKAILPDERQTFMIVMCELVI